MYLGQKLSGSILLLLDILLMFVIVVLAIFIAIIAGDIGQPEILEIRENGKGKWYEEPIKLQENYIPTDAAYILVIKDFIRGLRMVESFYDTNEYLVARALMCSTGSANKKLQEKLEAENPFELAGTTRIDVPYNSITVTKISQTQWKASWRERTYDNNGTKTMEADYESVFHTVLLDNEDTGSTLSPKKYNPLGIYIYEYDIDLLRKLM